MFGKLEAEEQLSRYAEVVSQVLEQALLEEPDPECRLVLCNQIIDLLSGSAGTPRKSHLEHRKLVSDPKPVLLEITPPWWFRTVAGTTPDGRRTLVIWRKLTDNAEQDNLVLDEWFKKQGYADRV